MGRSSWQLAEAIQTVRSPEQLDQVDSIQLKNKKAKNVNPKNIQKY